MQSSTGHWVSEKWRENRTTTSSREDTGWVGREGSLTTGTNKIARYLVFYCVKKQMHNDLMLFKMFVM